MSIIFIWPIISEITNMNASIRIARSFNGNNVFEPQKNNCMRKRGSRYYFLYTTIVRYRLLFASGYTIQSRNIKKCRWLRACLCISACVRARTCVCTCVYLHVHACLRTSCVPYVCITVSMHNYRYTSNWPCVYIRRQERESRAARTAMAILRYHNICIEQGWPDYWLLAALV